MMSKFHVLLHVGQVALKLPFLPGIIGPLLQERHIVLFILGLVGFGIIAPH